MIERTRLMVEPGITNPLPSSSDDYDSLGVDGVVEYIKAFLVSWCMYKSIPMAGWPVIKRVNIMYMCRFVSEEQHVPSHHSKRQQNRPWFVMLFWGMASGPSQTYI